MEAFAGIVLLIIAMFVYAGFTAVTEKLDEIIERLTPPRHVHAPVPGRTASSANVADIDEAPGIKLRLVADHHPDVGSIATGLSRFGSCSGSVDCRQFGVRRLHRFRSIHTLDSFRVHVHDDVLGLHLGRLLVRFSGIAQ
jgi:hypothetical protein